MGSASQRNTKTRATRIDHSFGSRQEKKSGVARPLLPTKLKRLPGGFG